MTLDLVPEPPPADRTPRRGGQHLTTQEVAVVVSAKDRHALVVGSEHRTEVEAEQTLVDQDED
jgi:hypothetical protein